jgi:hypothetical protein
MAQNPQDVQKLLDQIESTYRRIGQTNPFKNFDASAFTDVNDAINVLSQGLVTAKKKLQDLSGDVRELVGSFKAIVGEITNTNVGVTSTVKSFNKLTSIASKIQSDQLGITKLRAKELQTLEKQLREEKESLEANKELLKGKLQELYAKKRTEELTAKEVIELEKTKAAYRGIVGSLEDQDSAMNSLNAKLQQRIVQEEQIEKLEGLGGAAVEGTSAALDKLGFGGLSKRLGLDEVRNKMRETAEEIQKSDEYTGGMGDKMKVLKSGISEAGSQFVNNLKDPAVATTLVVKEFADALIKGDKATGELAKGFNMSYGAASNLRSELNTVANLTGDVNVNTQGLQESMMAVGKTLGSNAKLNKQDLITFTKLREQSGLTNENLASMQRFTLSSGGTLEDNTSEFLAQAQITAQNNGVVLNTKQLLEETANVSDAIKLSAGGTAGGFAKAAAQVKSLGMSLQQVDDIANSLLQFEDSITAELEAELLVGKDLTLEKARQAALNGDLATVGEEISKQIGSSAEFTKMNRIQQEALAKSVGMSRDDLAKTLVEREALAGLSGKEAKAGKEAFDALVEKYDVETATQMIKEKGFKTLMDQQSVQERFNKGIEKLRELFVGLAQPILSIVSPLIDLVTTVLPAINFLLSPLVEGFGLIGKAANYLADGLKKGEAPAIALSTILAVMARRQIAAAIGGIFSALSGIPFGVGLLLAGTAVAGMFSLLSKSTTAIQDGMIAPDGGLMVSGKKGTYQLDKNDTVVAGTDLGAKGAGGRAAGIDIGPLVAEMQNVRAVLQQILAKEGTVHIDSTKAGTAFAVGTSKLQ